MPADTDRRKFQNCIVHIGDAVLQEKGNIEVGNT